MKKIFPLVCFILSALFSLGQEQSGGFPSDPDVLMNTPAVPPRASAAVGRHIKTIESYFKKRGFETRSERNGEVLVVVIPASELFDANEIELKPESLKRFQAFEQAIVNPEAYRIIITCHSDDTGDEAYSDNLTTQRADNVHAAFEQIAAAKNIKSNIYHLGCAADKPLKPNNSIANRRTNRRIEIVIVPEQRTIDNARAGRV